MQWIKNHKLPTWAYMLGGLLFPVGALINVFTKHRLLGMSLICVGAWLIRWWLEAPADHSIFQKISEQRFRLYRNMMSVCSWGMLVLTVTAVCLYVFGVLP